MDETVRFPAMEISADDETLLAEMFAEMRRLNEQMERDRKEIERLRAETNELKSETRRLEQETRVILDRLKAAG